MDSLGGSKTPVELWTMDKGGVWAKRVERRCIEGVATSIWGVKHCKWSRRSSRTTVLCRGARLCWGRVFPVLIRARACAVVLGAEVRGYTELEEI